VRLVNVPGVCCTWRRSPVQYRPARKAWGRLPACRCSAGCQPVAARQAGSLPHHPGIASRPRRRQRRMFVYRCPGCGKWHLTAKEPEQGNRAQCPGCGRPIEVPETSQQPAPVHASTAPSPDSGTVTKSARSQSRRSVEAVTARRLPSAERPAPSKEVETPRDKITTQLTEETPAVTSTPPKKKSRPFKEKKLPAKGE
jgi:hypothetical protein